jgi:hypothetical protein
VKDDKDDTAAAALVLPAKTEPAAEEVAAEAEEKAEETTEPVSEPSGWAIAPESTTTTAEPTGVQPTRAATGAAAYQPAAEAVGATTPAAAATAAAAATPAAAAAATPAAAAAPAVPAGWYADPAGRFELRYWDGSTWTEHVSRAGQQFTDPPVARPTDVAVCAISVGHWHPDRHRRWVDLRPWFAGLLRFVVRLPPQRSTARGVDGADRAPDLSLHLTSARRPLDEAWLITTSTGRRRC